MTRAGERWASWCARMLDKQEGEAALGDLVEASATDGQALGQMSGLVLRRQISLWKDWRPWLALVGIVGVSGILLDRMTSMSILDVASDYWVQARFGVPYENGLTAHQNEIVVVWELIAAASWSWSSGLAAGVLARRASWIVSLALLIYAVWPFVLLVRVLPQSWHGVANFVVFPAVARFGVFVFPMLAGVQRGKSAEVCLRSAVRLGIWLSLVTVLMTWTSGWWQEAMVRWSEGAWHPGEAWPMRGLRYLFLSWPAGYLVALAAWERRKLRSNSV